MHATVGDRPYVNVYFDEVAIKALYDTGAGPTCLSLKAFQKAKASGLQTEKVQNDKTMVYNASGALMQHKGVHLIPTRILGMTVKIPILVIPNLQEECIIGMNLINALQLYYDPADKSVKVQSRSKHPASAQSSLGLQINAIKATTLFPHVATKTKLQVTEKGTNRPVAPGTEIECNMQGIPVVIKTGERGRFDFHIKNHSSSRVELEVGEWISEAIPFQEDTSQQVSTNISALSPTSDNNQKQGPNNVELAYQVAEVVNKTKNATLPTLKRLIEILKDNREAISRNSFDLGQADLLAHSITMRHNEPIYTKQFPIPTSQMRTVKDSVKEWVKLGVIEQTQSKYNSPIFCVPKKDNQGLRICQDYRRINAASLPDKYSIRTVEDCIAEIGEHKATKFAAIDLRHSFYQMALEDNSRKYSAFTIPGMGQYQWKVGAMGLAGCPATFSRLMDKVMEGQANVITYVDDLLIYAKSDEELLTTLDQVMKRLKKNNLKINLPKCKFLASEIDYLGHTLTKNGIRPAKTKAQDLIMAPNPKSLKEVRSFLGMANFFRPFIPNLAALAKPITELTKQESVWKRGPIPEEAVKAIRKIKEIISTRPVLAYPNAQETFHLFIDGSVGLRGKPGGLGAHLCQGNDKKSLKSVAFASRQLHPHENNYTAFMIEIAAAAFAVSHFQHHLKGKHFILHTDHKPMIPHTTMQVKTLNRLHHLLLEFDFEVQHVPGEENQVADFLSRTAEKVQETQITAVKEDRETTIMRQQNDPHIREAIKAVKGQHYEPQLLGPLSNWINNFRVIDDMLYITVKGRRGFLEGQAALRIVTPEAMKPKALKQGHITPEGVHVGPLRTEEEIRECQWWPNMTQEIKEFVQRCPTCSAHKPRIGTPPGLFPSPNGPNERVHADLFGPVKDKHGQKKFILVITDAFTKLVALQLLENKSAEQTTNALMAGWILVYGVPKIIVTDQGKEFCNNVQEQLWKELQVEHRTTTPYHPQCNGQAETFNRTMATMLHSILQEMNLGTNEATNLLQKVAFAYNTTVHSATKQSPFRTTFGYNPRQPRWPEIQETIKDDSAPPLQGQAAWDRWNAVREAARNAAHHNIQHNRQRETHQTGTTYQEGQLVWLWKDVSNEPNRKLDSKWTPATIKEVLGPATYKVRREGRRGRYATVNADHLKPRTVGEAEEHQEELQQQLQDVQDEIDAISSATRADLSIIHQRRKNEPLPHYLARHRWLTWDEVYKMANQLAKTREGISLQSYDLATRTPAPSQSSGTSQSPDSEDSSSTYEEPEELEEGDVTMQSVKEEEGETQPMEVDEEDNTVWVTEQEYDPASGSWIRRGVSPRRMAHRTPPTARPTPQKQTPEEEDRFATPPSTPLQRGRSQRLKGIIKIPKLQWGPKQHQESKPFTSFLQQAIKKHSPTEEGSLWKKKEEGEERSQTLPTTEQDPLALYTDQKKEETKKTAAAERPMQTMTQQILGSGARWKEGEQYKPIPLPPSWPSKTTEQQLPKEIRELSAEKKRNYMESRDFYLQQDVQQERAQLVRDLVQRLEAPPPVKQLGSEAVQDYLTKEAYWMLGITPPESPPHETRSGREFLQHSATRRLPYRRTHPLPPLPPFPK